MKLKISCRAQHFDWNLEFNIKGLGTYEDPYILEPGGYDDKSLFTLSLMDSNSYLEIRNQHLRALYLSKCSNIILSKSTFSKVILTNSSNIILNNLEIYRKLRIDTSSSIDIFKSTIKRLDVIESDDIFTSECIIARLKKRSLLSSIALELSKIIGFKSYFQNLFL